MGISLLRQALTLFGCEILQVPFISRCCFCLRYNIIDLAKEPVSTIHRNKLVVLHADVDYLMRLLIIIRCSCFVSLNSRFKYMKSWGKRLSPPASGSRRKLIIAIN